MMSISPHDGHSWDIPSVHIAGHEPWKAGIFARTKKRPYCHECKPWVLMDDEV
jgi:hypothetical protein